MGIKQQKNGNVGIGTASPASRLHVEGSEPHITLFDTRGVKSFVWRNNFDSASQNTLLLMTSQDTSDAKVAITSAGKVGIGTTSPAQKLEVAGGRIRVKKTGGTVGSAEIFVAVGDATSRSGTALCESALGANDVDAVCLAHWNSAGVEATCSNARTDARALCTIFGD